MRTYRSDFHEAYPAYAPSKLCELIFLEYDPCLLKHFAPVLQDGDGDGDADHAEEISILFFDIHPPSYFLLQKMSTDYDDNDDDDYDDKFFCISFHKTAE